MSSEWGYNNELYIIKSLTDKIRELRKNYILDEVYLTTFSLDYDQLQKVLYDIDALGIVAEEKVNVYYDMADKTINPHNSKILSSKNLHGIIVDNSIRKTLYAFHPKVILMRYIQKEKDDNSSVRYIAGIFSKNISNSMLLDTYALTYGDVDHKSYQNVMGMSEFWKQVFEYSHNADNEALSDKEDNILEELKHTCFYLAGEENEPKIDVEFLNAKDVKEEITHNKENMIVVSPFLSDLIINEINIKKLVTTVNGLKSLYSKDTIEAIKDCTYVLPEDKLSTETDNTDNKGLHAKIYCYKEYSENKKKTETVWILGSSNATNNGMGENIEYNIKFKTQEEDYVQFDKLLENNLRKLNKLDLDIISSHDNSEKCNFDARKYFYEFVKNIDINCRYTDKKDVNQTNVDKNINQRNIDNTIENNKDIKNEQYIVSICKKKSLDKEQDYIGYVKGNTGYELLTKENIIIKSDKPVSELCVKIANKDNNMQYREFSIDLYNKWKTEQIKSILDDECKKVYIDTLRNIQEQILKGKKNVSFVRRTDSDSKTLNSVKTHNIDKNYIFEKIIKVYQDNSDKAARIAALNKIKEMSEIIYNVKPDSEYDKQMIEFIDMIEQSGNNKGR